MDIKVVELDDKPTRVEFQLTQKDFNRLGNDLTFEQMSCQAEISRKGETFYLVGKYIVDIQATCDVCLQPVSIHLDNDFDLNLFAAEDRIEPESDSEISVREPNIDYYEGQDLHLSQYFEDQLLLDMPISIRCQEECQGICPTCGINKNTENCQCADESVSSPFAVLKDLKL
jgi:uncharacterized protein